MRNDDDRLVWTELCKGFKHRAFGWNIESRSRFIQDKRYRLLQEGTGYGKPLTLSARKADCSRAEGSVEPLRELAENGCELNYLDYPKHLFSRRPRIAIQEILPDAPLKEHGVLRDQTDGASQRRQGIVFERLLFEQDVPGIRIGGARK